MIKGIGENQDISHILNLQFADDTLSFSRIQRENITSLKFILYSYELLSGLKISFEKSTMIGIELFQKVQRLDCIYLGQ